MPSTPPSSSAIQWLTGISCCFAVAVFGVLAGGVIAARVTAMSNMGVDQISTALGGAMAGGMAGGIAGALLGIRLRPRGHLLVATLALIATIAVVFLAIAVPSWGVGQK